MSSLKYYPNSYMKQNFLKSLKFFSKPILKPLLGYYKINLVKNFERASLVVHW